MSVPSWRRITQKWGHVVARHGSGLYSILTRLSMIVRRSVKIIMNGATRNMMMHLQTRKAYSINKAHSHPVRNASNYAGPMAGPPHLIS